MFRVSVALKPEAWTEPGDGVLFLIGVSDGYAYRQMKSVVMGSGTDGNPTVDGATWSSTFASTSE